MPKKFHKSYLNQEEEEQKTGPFKPAQESPVVDLSGDSSYLVIFGLGHCSFDNHD